MFPEEIAEARWALAALPMREVVERLLSLPLLVPTPLCGDERDTEPGEPPAFPAGDERGWEDEGPVGPRGPLEEVDLVLDWEADFMAAPAAELEPEAARTIVVNPYELADPIHLY